jgi:hypothetical protein
MKLLTLILLTLLAVPVTAQDYTVTLSTENVDAKTLGINMSFTMPKADAAYYNKRFGTDELKQKLSQFIRKHIRNRIGSERQNDWNRWKQYAPASYKQQLEQIEKDSIAAREARTSEEIGMLSIGKSYAEPFDFMRGWEGGGGSDPLAAGHAPGMGEDLLKAAAYVIVIGAVLVFCLGTTIYYWTMKARGYGMRK